MQPFGYTGYRMDDVSGMYFAQVREYQAQDGRFVAEDVVKGNGLLMETLNQYLYCLNNPMVLTDCSGKMPNVANQIFFPYLKSIGMEYVEWQNKSVMEYYETLPSASQLPVDSDGLMDYTELITNFMEEKRKELYYY